MHNIFSPSILIMAISSAVIHRTCFWKAIMAKDSPACQRFFHNLPHSSVFLLNVGIVPYLSDQMFVLLCTLY